jgi:hypothetical protein
MHTGWTSICSDDAKKAVHAKGLEALLSEVKLQFIIAAHLPKLAAGLMSDNLHLLTYSPWSNKESVHHQFDGADNYPVSRFSACFSQGFPYPVPDEPLLNFCQGLRVIRIYESCELLHISTLHEPSFFVQLLNC